MGCSTQRQWEQVWLLWATLTFIQPNIPLAYHLLKKFAQWLLHVCFSTLSEAAFSLVGNLACKTLEVEKPGWSVHVGRISRPVTDIPIRKTEISATVPAHLLIIYEHIKILTKEIVVRRDLGNRASPVN